METSASFEARSAPSLHSTEPFVAFEIFVVRMSFVKCCIYDEERSENLRELRKLLLQ